MILVVKQHLLARVMGCEGIRPVITNNPRPTPLETIRLNRMKPPTYFSKGRASRYRSIVEVRVTGSREEIDTMLARLTAIDATYEVKEAD
jgi:hypothetical protein